MTREQTIICVFSESVQEALGQMASLPKKFSDVFTLTQIGVQFPEKNLKIMSILKRFEGKSSILFYNLL